MMQLIMLLLGTIDPNSPLQKLRGQGDLLERLWRYVLSMSPSAKLQGHNDAVCSVVQLAGGRLVTGSWDNTLKVWDPGPRPAGESHKPKKYERKKRCKGACLLTLKGHSDHVTCIAPLADGGLVSGSWDRTLRVWNAEGECEVILEGHCNYVNSVVQMADGRILSGSQDETLRVWERKGRAPTPGESTIPQCWDCTLVLKGHRNDITCVVQLEDGRVASGSFDKTVRIWNVVGGDGCVSTLVGHEDEVNSVTQLLDGRLVSGSVDMTLRVWDITEETSTCLLVLEGHTKAVVCVAPLQDGRVISGSEDRTLRLWSMQHRTSHVAILEGHTDDITCVAQLKDGRVASGSHDGALWLWS